MLSPSTFERAAAGSQVDDHGRYALSVLRARFGGLITGLVTATLFVPPIVLLVPLYVTIVDVPLVHLRLIDNCCSSGQR